MKKAKVMLTSIAVVAIVSGVFAFKAQRSGLFLYTYDSDNNSCNTFTTDQYQIQAGGTEFPSATLSSTVPATCTSDISVVTAE